MDDAEFLKDLKKYGDELQKRVAGEVCEKIKEWCEKGMLNYSKKLVEDGIPVEVVSRAIGVPKESIPGVPEESIPVVTNKKSRSTKRSNKKYKLLCRHKRALHRMRFRPKIRKKSLFRSSNQSANQIRTDKEELKKLKEHGKELKKMMEKKVIREVSEQVYKKGILEFAKKLVEDGIPMEDVSEATRISEESILVELKKKSRSEKEEICSQKRASRLLRRRLMRETESFRLNEKADWVADWINEMSYEELIGLEDHLEVIKAYREAKRKEFVRDAMLDVVRKCVDDGLDLDDVSTCSGFSKEEILKGLTKKPVTTIFKVNKK